MNRYMQMLLKWAREDKDFAFCAHGWLLRDKHDQNPRLDAVERQYIDNIITARLRGISA